MNTLSLAKLFSGHGVSVTQISKEGSRLGVRDYAVEIRESCVPKNFQETECDVLNARESDLAKRSHERLPTPANERARHVVRPVQIVDGERRYYGSVTGGNPQAVCSRRKRRYGGGQSQSQPGDLKPSPISAYSNLSTQGQQPARNRQRPSTDHVVP